MVSIKSLMIGCLAGLLVSTTACSPSKPSNAAKPLTKVTVAVPTLDMGFLPSILAKEKGYFADDGLDVNLRVMQASVAVAALTAKQVQFAVAGSSVRAAEQGAALRGVFYSYHECTFMAVGAPSIHSFQDLHGKTIGIFAPGGSDDIITKLLLKRENIPVTDVNIVPLGAAEADGLRAGRAQFALVNPDVAVRLEKQGFHILGDTRGLQPIPWSGLATNVDTLTQQRPMVKAFLHANVRAELFIRQHPDEAAAFAATKFGLDAESARRAIDLILPAISADDPGGFTRDGLITLIKTDMATLKLSGDPEQIGAGAHDLGPLREAQRELGIRCVEGYKCT